IDGPLQVCPEDPPDEMPDQGAPYETGNHMLVGYARCSTTHQDQDLTAQRERLMSLGVEAENIYTDAGLSGTNRDRPGLRESLAATRAGDTYVVTKLDRLVRSVRDAKDIADELEAK